MPLNTLSQIFNTTAIKAIPNQNNNLLDFVGTSGTTVASVTAGGVLDLRATSGTILGEGSSVIGNKIQLWANTYGIGIQGSRLVIYNDSTAATSIRTSLTGSDIIRFNNDGNISGRYLDSIANSGSYLDLGVGTAGIIAVNRNASHVPLTVRGAVSQSASLQEWQSSAGTVVASLAVDGAIRGNYLTNTTNTNPYIDISSGSVGILNRTTTSNIPLFVRGMASQSGDLQQWQNSAGTVLVSVSSSGAVSINTTGTGTINLGDGILSKTSGTGFQFNSGAVFTSTISASGLAGSLLSSATPIVNGTAASGTSAIPSRQDHVHGTDTSRAPIASPTFTGSVTLPGAPSSALEAATKQYVDDVAQGLHIHASVSAATTANLTATYANGTAGVGATLTNSGTLAAFSVDGLSPAQNDRVLVKNQSTTFQNGIYTLTTVGSVSVAWVLTRATDFDTAAEMDGGDFVFVTAGTVGDNTGWVQTETVTTVGTSPVLFTQFSGAGTYTAGNGLTLNSNQFVINTAITADLSTAQTFTNKTLTSPTLTTPSIGVATGTSFNSITGLSSTTPVVDGTAAVGTGTTAARGDHVHPTDTSRAATAGTLAQFAATTSAQLAGVISDETGSGLLVFATSPTLTTPSIGVATGTSFNSITGLSSTAPAALGTSAVGTGTTTARADHVHSNTADQFIASNNGNGTNFRVGDDVWLGDINIANTMSVRGVSAATSGFIRFGSDTNALG